MLCRRLCHHLQVEVTSVVALNWQLGLQPLYIDLYSLQFDGIHVVSGSLDTSIRVWDVETGNCIHTLTGHQSLTSGMELKDNILVSGNADSTVKIWDIKTGQCLQTLQGEIRVPVGDLHTAAFCCPHFSSVFEQLKWRSLKTLRLRCSVDGQDNGYY